MARAAVTPTARQIEIRDAPQLDLLVTAPAGCGKTEALALRVRGLLDRGQVQAPKRVLVATFTNRSRDNIRERLAEHLSLAAMRRFVTVQNFHGLSARIFLAHSNVIGMTSDIRMPEADWVGDQCRAKRLTFAQSGIVQDLLRVAKQTPRTDDEVLEFLREAQNPSALSIELLRQEENLLTYDDLPRLAQLILRSDAVASLYRNHFAAVVVDEFQDLTPQQLQIIQRIGANRTTYAGDLAQGIYGFAGAAPEQVHKEVASEVSREISFAESHRSSPAVLAVVNALTPIVGGNRLTSAAPKSWPAGGVTGHRSFADTADEAEWILRFTRAVLHRAPRHRVAAISRTKPRRRFLDEVLANVTDTPWFRWDDPVLDSQAGQVLRSVLGRVAKPQFDAADDRLNYLWSLTRGVDLQDPSTREALTSGLGWLADLLAEGTSIAEIRKRIKIGDEGSLLDAPGLHLLTGHVGKGQQFDWVFVIGMEDGTIPDFRANSDATQREEARVLSVMLSRARHGVFMSNVKIVATATGDLRRRDPSRFLSLFKNVETHLDGTGMVSWLNSADWVALSNR
ncbi:ATP-dependent helicase [Paenarthrobacter ureafaciens]